MIFGAASRLGLSRFDETPPLERVSGASSEDLDIIIRAVYRQVLGNSYVMESERLSVLESEFKLGKLSICEFVRMLAQSDLYRSRFFTSCARYRAIELNFRHLLGRTPLGLEEMQLHSTIIDTMGFEAEIDSYVYSDEYQNVFGENCVPYIRGYRTEACGSLLQFTHLFQMVRGASTSSLKGDLAGKRPKLNSLVINSIPTPIVSPSSAGSLFYNPPLSSRTRHGVGASAEGQVFRIEVTGYKSNTVNKISRFRRSNQVYLVPFDRLSEEYKRIHKQGGVIASITPVN